MAELRDVRCSTDGEPGGNGRGFAGHLLSTDQPTVVFEDWRQLRYEPNSGLPRELGPFDLHGSDQTGWAIFNWADKRKWDVKDDFPTVWDAFEVMLREYREWHAKLARPVVYFIGTELLPGYPVKIGFTRNLQSRLGTLQTAHPERLKVFATVPGDHQLEEAYHRRWRIRRQQGEWFTLGKCIIDEIQRLNAKAA